MTNFQIKRSCRLRNARIEDATGVNIQHDYPVIASLKLLKILNSRTMLHTFVLLVCSVDEDSQSPILYSLLWWLEPVIQGSESMVQAPHFELPRLARNSHVFSVMMPRQSKEMSHLGKCRNIQLV